MNPKTVFILPFHLVDDLADVKLLMLRMLS